MGSINMGKLKVSLFKVYPQFKNRRRGLPAFGVGNIRKIKGENRNTMCFYLS
tara:strand:+ start:238 stop:393 length:156 start_codon:yes stop_codon:yes gene_type:complete